MKAFKVTINGVDFVNSQVVADYYGVTKETIHDWIKDGKISGKQVSNQAENYFIPLEEFEYLKKRREEDQTEDVIWELFGKDYHDWYLEPEED